MRIDSIFRLAVFAFILFCSSQIFATTDTITYKDYSYSPATLSVKVGDTIVWDGAPNATNFNNHPLKDSSVPNGAAHFGPIETGVTFSYVITVPGVYSYRCENHYFLGMRGTFTATGEARVKQAANEILNVSNFPNPLVSKTVVHYTLSKPDNVEFRVFDLTGRILYHVSQGYQNIGSHEVNFDASALPSGKYMYVIQSGEAILERQMIVVK
jgi:plastocyanin